MVGVVPLLAACGGGKGGLPTSLNEHAEIVCNASWSDFEKMIENAKGQEKDLLIQRKKTLDKKKICSCTQKMAGLGRVNYDTRGEQGVVQELVSFNVTIGESLKNGQLQSMYDAFKKYKLEETLPNVRTLYTLVNSDLTMLVGACSNGVDPESKFLIKR